jgi:predicted SprT family Zn-dependent metalloprotease
MTKRYFKATDRDITVFRASDTKVYRSATKTGRSISFSSAPAGLGAMSAVEITKAEYTALVALKQARVQASGGRHDDGGAPSDSWVANDAIPGTPAEHPENAAIRHRLGIPPAPDVANPTSTTYAGLTEAYDHFNQRLFAGRLPRCLVTLQRKTGTFGYFAGGRFGTADGSEVTDEIALNPSHFRDRTTEQSLSTLVHEMTHLEQHHHGKPSRNGYHNKEWAGLMRQVGLIPSSTGEEGGKDTGQKVSHYIEPGGRFATACAELLKGGYAVRYVELWGEGADKARAKKAASKTKYTCGSCGANAWAKPDAHLNCGDCDEAMEAG